MVDTTGKCSACGQTVGIDTIHTCSPQVTRPRVEGARVTDTEALIWCSSLEPAIRDLALDLMYARQQVHSLTAEVERLTKELRSLTHCDCGRTVGRGFCGVCDNDE